MIIKIAFSTLLSLACPSPEIIVKEGLTWKEEDSIILKRAEKGCQTYYGKDSCLIKFIKTGENNYRAVCKDTN